MSQYNPYLNAKNENAVTQLLQDCKAKTVWQVCRESRGKAKADMLVSLLWDQPFIVVRAARFYWES